MKRTPILAAAGALLALALLGRAPASADDAPAAAEAKTVLHEGSGVSETHYPNGFTLLVRPEPECPVVTTMVWYAVGSRDEDVAETGLSHYLEHMLFKGTTKYPVGAIDRITQANGGSNNASTREDATEYHFQFPADRWEVALEIEADRMRNSAVLPREFDAEKNVVLQELKRDLDDPSQVLEQAVEAAAFPVGFYHHPVIGWPEDVRSTTRDRMMRYYLKHYTPDRATLVVVGGVDRDRVVRRVGELFGPIPRGEVVRQEMTEPPPLGETRLTLVQDAQVPRLVLAFRSLKLLDPREPHLDLLSEILSGEKTSRLDKALVDTGIAAAVEAWSDTRRDDGLFTIVVQPAPGHTLDEVEAAAKKVLADVVEKGVTADEVKLARAKLVASQVFQQESTMGYASRLGSMAVVGDWRYVLRYPSVLEAATPEGLQALARSVFDPALAVVGRSVPRAAAADKGGGSSAGAAAPGGGGRRRAAFDKGAHGARSRDPDAAAGSEAVIERALTLKPLRTVLPNGLTVIALRRQQAPVFSAALSVENGYVGEAVPGLDALTGALLDEGTTKRTAEQIEQAIGAVGGSLGVGSGGVTAKTLSKDAALALEVMDEVATSPAFAPEALDRVKERQVAAIDEEMDIPATVAKSMFDEAVYGPTHPLGRYPKGTAATVRSITREQVVAHHARFWVPKNAMLVMVTDRDPAEVTALAEKAFGGWKGGDKPVVDVPPPPAPQAKTLRRDVPRAQANLYLGHAGILRRDPDYLALEVMDNVFGTGSGFTDRLSKTIRDQAGLAYTVYGNITRSAGLYPGEFVMYAGTNPEDADRALGMMREQLKGLLERPPTPEEMAGAKAALRGAMIDSCETSDGLVAVLRMCERHGLGFDYPHRYVDDLEKVTAEDVVRVARAHLHPDALVQVVVGPAAAKPPAPGK